MSEIIAFLKVRIVWKNHISILRFILLYCRNASIRKGSVSGHYPRDIAGNRGICSFAYWDSRRAITQGVLWSLLNRLFRFWLCFHSIFVLCLIDANTALEGRTLWNRAEQKCLRLRSERGNGWWNADRFQIAMTKGVCSYHFQPVRKVDMPQTGAICKCLISDFLQFAWKGDLFQSWTESKGGSFNTC